MPPLREVSSRQLLKKQLHDVEFNLSPEAVESLASVNPKLLGEQLSAVNRLMKRGFRIGYFSNEHQAPVVMACDSLEALASKNTDTDVFNISRFGLPKTLEVFQKSGVRADLNLIERSWETLSSLCSKYTADSYTMMISLVPQALRALSQAGVRVDLSALRRLDGFVDKAKPLHVDYLLCTAFPMTLAAMKESSMPMDLDVCEDTAINLVDCFMKPGYLAKLQDHLDRLPPQERFETLCYYSQPLPEEEKQRVRDLPLYVRVYENASLNALDGLVNAAGFSNVFASPSARFTSEHVHSGLRKRNLAGRVQIGYPLPNEFSIIFRDGAMAAGPKTEFEVFGYQPFKYSLPKPLTDGEKTEFRDSLGFDAARNVVVLGSPNTLDFDEFVEAYAGFSGKNSCHLIVALPMSEPKINGIIHKFKGKLDTVGLDYGMRSDPQHKGRDVVLLDSVGELVPSYAIAGRVFVGSDRNLMEPASQGKHSHHFGIQSMHNQTALQLLEKHGATSLVDDSSGVRAVLETVGQPTDPEEQTRAFAAIREMRDEILPGYGELALKIAHIRHKEMGLI